MCISALLYSVSALDKSEWEGDEGSREPPGEGGRAGGQQAPGSGSTRGRSHQQEGAFYFGVSKSLDLALNLM